MNNYDWEKMTPLEEVYAIRKRIAEKFGYSLDAIFERESRNSARRRLAAKCFTLPSCLLLVLVSLDSDNFSCWRASAATVSAKATNAAITKIWYTICAT